MTDSNPKNYRKASTYIFTNLLPIYQQKYEPFKKLTQETHSKQQQQQQHQNSSHHHPPQQKKPKFDSTSTQCELIKPRLDVNLASLFKIHPNALFHEPQVKKLLNPKFTATPIQLPTMLKSNKNTNNMSLNSDPSNKRKASFIHQQEIGVQTYELQSLDERAEKKSELLIEDLMLLVSTKTTSTNNSKLVRVFEQFSENSLVHILKYFTSNLNKFHLTESLLKLNPEKLKLLDDYIEKLGEDDKLDLEVELTRINEKQRRLNGNVRFETGLARPPRFKKFVHSRIILNLEWFKTLNKDNAKNKEMEKLLLDYHKFENLSDFLDGKKMQLLFNKEEFRAQKTTLSTLLTDVHRGLLAKEASVRTNAEAELLASTLIHAIPRLNTFPKHVCAHIGRIMRLCVFEKGREVVREGHHAIGYYYVVTGGCDVLSIGVNGLLKVDDLRAGDVFGENAFVEGGRGVNETTVIANQHVELLVVEPYEIDMYLENLRIIEKQMIKDFISNWWPVKYWNWTEDNFEQFAQNSKFVRYNHGNIVHANSIHQIEKIFFIYKGKIDLIRQIDRPLHKNRKNPKNLKTSSTSSSSSLLSCESVVDGSVDDDDDDDEMRLMTRNLYKICTLEKYHYFGFDLSQNVNMWFLACEDDCNVIEISREAFLSIHKHAEFFLSQLIADYNLTIPNLDELSRSKII